jgi:DNA end-binding protein Ku
MYTTVRARTARVKVERCRIPIPRELHAASRAIMQKQPSRARCRPREAPSALACFLLHSEGLLRRLGSPMRPIWTGTISFGLLNIPVSLLAGERRTDLQFRMLDSRDHSPVRYERVNAESGEEVPWKEIVKAFEYDKGNYVVLEDEDFRKAAVEGRESVEIASFVEEREIDTRYFEKPYVLVPSKKAEKGYVLLRETLRDLGKVGIARVIIRTREYLAMVKPLEQALVLILLRFPQELVDLADFDLPRGNDAAYRIQKVEREMARQLIESMSVGWKPGDYKDEYRDRLTRVIEQRMKQAGRTTAIDDAKLRVDDDEGAATNVVDFTALLKQSLATNRRTPAARSVAKAAAKAGTKAKAAPRKTAARKPAARKPAKPRTEAPAKAATPRRAAAKGTKRSASR